MLCNIDYIINYLTLKVKRNKTNKEITMVCSLHAYVINGPSYSGKPQTLFQRMRKSITDGKY